MLGEAESTDREGGWAVLNSLTDQDWIDLLDRLTLFVNSYYYDVDAEDLVMEAIEAVIAGRRSWNPQKPPFNNFCQIIRSVASNQLAKKKIFVHLDPDAEVSTTHNAPSTSPAIPSHAETYEQQENDDNFRSRLRQLLQGDSLLLRLVEYLINDPTRKPKDIAEDLGEKKKEIYNARKRLVRKLKELMEVPRRVL